MFSNAMSYLFVLTGAASWRSRLNVGSLGFFMI